MGDKQVDVPSKTSDFSIYPPHMNTFSSTGQTNDRAMISSDLTAFFSLAPPGIGRVFFSSQSELSSKHGIEQVDMWGVCCKLARLCSFLWQQNHSRVFSAVINANYNVVRNIRTLSPYYFDFSDFGNLSVEYINAMLLALCRPDSIGFTDSIPLPHFHSAGFNTTDFYFINNGNLNPLFALGAGFMINTPQFRAAVITLVEDIISRVLANVAITKKMFYYMLGLAILGHFRILIVRSDGLSYWDHLGDFGPPVETDDATMNAFSIFLSRKVPGSRDHSVTLDVPHLIGNSLFLLECNRIRNNIWREMTSKQEANLDHFYVRTVGMSIDKHLGVPYFFGGIEPFTFVDPMTVCDLQVSTNVTFLFKNGSVGSVHHGSKRAAFNLLSAIFGALGTVHVNGVPYVAMYSNRSLSVFAYSNFGMNRIINPFTSTVIVDSGAAVTISITHNNWLMRFQAFYTRLFTFSGSHTGFMTVLMGLYNKVNELFANFMSSNVLPSDRSGVPLID